ncbi:hypothetical protein BJY04DRAFT_207430 [Aspergillus karnatakaensis]|uniref:putative C6 transcription factor n=1 Tax=Aspergillus karnatakaensis TaxID=1810916 RepID=UPI003CCD7AD5
MTPQEGGRRRLRSNHASSTPLTDYRRKKTRCPGEKPACSCCVRLGQQCSYAAAGGSTSGPSKDRIAELEEKVNQILRGAAHQQERQVQEEAPEFSSVISHGDGSYPQESAFPSIFGLDDASPQASSLFIAKAIDIYLECCHRQPVWCLNIKELGNIESHPEELICSILALTMRFARDPDQGKRYADSAKSLIMLRIANGSVELATIESLCLLAYSSFIDGYLQQGRFYLGLGLQLCRAAMLDTEAAYTREDRQGEQKKRLFWSLQLLEQSYGRQSGLLNIPTATWRPPHLPPGHREPERDPSSKPPPVPRDTVGCSSPEDTGIWTMSIYFGWVWSKVRAYVSDCANNRLTEPWRHESMYSVVLSDLTEIENSTSLCHRYDHVQFYRRTADDLARNRAYWVPWVKLQFMYHAILTVLNHPFLYIIASQHNPNLAIPNSFWRRSSELVLLHATWIVRLIDMVSEKQVRLTDPFFGHVAAIAASVQLYYCCADDPRLKYKSRADLAKCTDFLRSFVPFSRACDVLSQKLDELTRIASGSDNIDLDDWVPSKIHLNIPLMWDILQFNVSDETPGSEGLLHRSLVPTAMVTGAQEVSNLDIIVTASPEVSVNTTDGGQAVPMPLYRSPTTATAESLRQTSLRDNLIAPIDSLMSNTPWLWADSAQFANMDDVEYNNAAPVIGDVEGSAWWNLGNL